MKKLTPLIVAAGMLMVVAGCTAPVKKDVDILYEICEASHLFELHERDRLAFTFNVQLPDRVVKRSWLWHIDTGRITLNGKAHQPSQKFVNDIYWLIFPLKAYEDRDQIQLQVNADRKSPLLGEHTTEVVVRYVSGKGYTPNDTYKLYVDDNYRIREWQYLKGGKAPPKRETVWGNYRDIGGITFSLERTGTDGFKVWFTDVDVR
jgi:hypothetical protein